MEKITIVIPNYNGMKYLPGCLDSIKPEKQKAAVSYRILVIDNGSTDGSVEFLKTCKGVDSIFLDTNTGFCHAVNVGITESATPYVLLLNNDTKAFPGFVQNLYNSIHGKKKCFSVSAQMLMWDDESLLDDAGDLYCCLGWSRSRGKGKPAGAYGKATKIFSACGGAAIYRKEVFDRIGLFDELHFAYLEDLDVGYRAKLYGYYNKYEPLARVLHYGSASTGSRYNEKKTELSSANNIYVIFKNMPGIQIFFNFLPLLAGFTAKFLFFAKKKMGMKYLKGLGVGFKRSFSSEGRKHRIKFKGENFVPVLKIQLELWKNTFAILADK